MQAACIARDDPSTVIMREKYRSSSQSTRIVQRRKFGNGARRNLLVRTVAPKVVMTSRRERLYVRTPRHQPVCVALLMCMLFS